MKILSLEAENVKRLRAVSLAFKDGLIVISGENGAGKSSCLDAIAMALGGKSFVCDQPLRKGEAKGHVTISLGDPGPLYKVTRRFGLKGTTSLVIEAADGSRPSSPQTILDGCLGALSFDPLAFSRMDVKAQAETLRRLVGLDTSQVDAQIATEFTRRTDLGREVTRLEGAFNSMPEHPGAPKQESDVSALAAELTAAQESAHEKERVEDLAKTLSGAATIAGRRAEELAAEIEELTKEMADAKATQAKKSQESKQALANAASIQVPDVAGIRQKIDASATVNAQVRANATRATARAALSAKRTEHEAADRKVTALRDSRAKAILSCTFPVDGLALDEGGVMLNGLPFSQASHAEQLRVSVAMGLAMNPKLRLLLIHDGSLLDEKNLALVSDMADKAGAQILMERVSVDARTSVVIEDGMVAE